MTKPTSPTINEAIADYLYSIELTRAKKTWQTYQTGMNQFRDFLVLSDFDPEEDGIDTLSEQTAGNFAQALLDKRFSSATVNLYLTAVSAFFEYLALELETDINLERLRRLIKSKSPKLKRRLPQFSWDDIEMVLSYCLNVMGTKRSDQELKTQLQDLRDRAFILTLADTGLRVHEACKLIRSDIDWNRKIALVTGKGDKDALVRFSHRAINAIQDYLSQRAILDGATGRPLASLPIFARHDRGAGKKILSISTFSGQKIVSRRAEEALQDAEKAAAITPHSFRHYFVTRVVKSTNNIKVAQELARHENISTTEIYTHLVDQDLDRFYDEAIEGDG